MKRPLGSHKGRYADYDTLLNIAASRFHIGPSLYLER